MRWESDIHRPPLRMRLLTPVERGRRANRQTHEGHRPKDVGRSNTWHEFWVVVSRVCLRRCARQGAGVSDQNDALPHVESPSSCFHSERRDGKQRAPKEDCDRQNHGLEKHGCCWKMKTCFELALRCCCPRLTTPAGRASWLNEGMWWARWTTPAQAPIAGKVAVVHSLVGGGGALECNRSGAKPRR